MRALVSVVMCVACTAGPSPLDPGGGATTGVSEPPPGSTGSTSRGAETPPESSDATGRPATTEPGATDSSSGPALGDTSSSTGEPGTSTGAFDPESCHHPEYRFVEDGSCVELGGLLHNTRSSDGVEDRPEWFAVNQRNATGARLPAAFRDRGRVEWDAYYEPGVLEEGGGGKHFHQVMRFVGDRAGIYQDDIQMHEYLRVEIARLGTQPILSVRTHGSGDDITLWDLDGLHMLESRWYAWALQWDFDPETAALNVVIELDDDHAWSFDEQFNPGTLGPGGYWFPLAHVETNSGHGRVRTRAVQYIEL